MTDEQANDGKTFTCDHHAKSVSNQLHVFFKEKELTDVVLVADIDNIEVDAHRVVLSASSNYFRALFRSMLREAASGIIQLKEISGEVLKLILDFMYTASIELHKDTVESVLKSADLFQLDTLVKGCCDFMADQIGHTNCLGIAILAERHSYTTLYEKAMAYACDFFEEVCKGQEFLQLSELQLTKFLSQDTLCIPSQENLFLSLVEWLNYDEMSREDSMYCLLNEYVRYSLLEPKFIIQKRKLLSHIFKCSELLCSWLEWHLVKEKEKKRKIFLTCTYEGTFSVYSYDPDLNKWSTEDWPQPSQMREDYGTVISDGKCIIAGGDIDGIATNTVECLDLQSKKWYFLPPMITPRSYLGLAEKDGALYAVAGRNRNVRLFSIEKFDFKVGAWIKLTDIQSTFYNTKALFINEILYVKGSNQHYLECFDLGSRKWTKTECKNEKSKGYSIASVRGELYAVGGVYDSKQKSKTIERYNQSSNTWTVIGSLHTEREIPCCISIDDRLLVCGGSGGGTVFEEFNIITKKSKLLAKCDDSFTKRNTYPYSDKLSLVDE